MMLMIVLFHVILDGFCDSFVAKNEFVLFRVRETEFQIVFHIQCIIFNIHFHVS